MKRCCVLSFFLPHLKNKKKKRKNIEKYSNQANKVKCLKMPVYKFIQKYAKKSHSSWPLLKYKRVMMMTLHQIQAEWFKNLAIQ